MKTIKKTQIVSAMAYNIANWGNGWDASDLPKKWVRESATGHEISLRHLCKSVFSYQNTVSQYPNGRLCPKTVISAIGIKKPLKICQGVILEPNIDNQTFDEILLSCCETYGLDIDLARAVSSVESISAHNRQGLATARFEPHIFKRRTGFVMSPYRRNQISEWNKIIEMSKKFNANDAIASASFGAFQIMGFNYSLLGYKDPADMLMAFQFSVNAQVEGFFDYCVSTDCLESLQKGHFLSFAKSYNGPANIINYSNKIEKELKKIRKK